MKIHLLLSALIVTQLGTLALASHNHHHHHHHNGPQQVHLSLGTDQTEMVVTWVTMHSVDEHTYVKYGRHENELNHKSQAEVSKFKFYDKKKGEGKFYTYRALMTGLKPNTKYFYKVGNHKRGWSKEFHFKTLDAGHKWLPSFAIYGDMGLDDETEKETKSFPLLAHDVRHNMYDAIFHIGDLAYNLETHHGEQGHNFMRNIEPIASKVPYMTCTGNHEQHDNFSHYDARFSMIGDRAHPKHEAQLSSRLNNHYYSVDIGPAHVILFSTEFYYFTKYGWDQIRIQYEWLKHDLKRANKNRKERPWIIVMGHRPLYCLKEGDKSCIGMERPDIRRGVHWKQHRKHHHHHEHNSHDHHGHHHHHHNQSEDKHHNHERIYGLEELFYEQGVDLQFYGHEHYYVRMAPMHNFHAHQKGHNDRYHNPKGPIHITTGSAGCWENHSHFLDIPDWVAKKSHDYGYTRLRFVSRHEVVLEQVSVKVKNQDGNGVLDRVTIIKDHNFPQWLSNSSSTPVQPEKGQSSSTIDNSTTTKSNKLPTKKPDSNTETKTTHIPDENVSKLTTINPEVVTSSGNPSNNSSTPPKLHPKNQRTASTIRMTTYRPSLPSLPPHL